MLIFFIITLISTFYGTNYSSSICGSYIIYNSNSIQKANSILGKEKYLKGECIPSYVIIKLCNKIRIQNITILNKEFFSNFPGEVKFSIFKDNWIDLGNFKGKYTRKKQKFYINSEIYSNILKIEFLSFLGKHSLFTLSEIGVFGNTIFDNIKHENEIVNLKRNDFNIEYFKQNEFDGIMKNLLFFDNLIQSGKKIFFIFIYGGCFIICLIFSRKWFRSGN